MPTTRPEVPPVGRAERAVPSADPSITVGIWKSLVMTEAGSSQKAAPKKKSAWNAWNPDDPRLTPEKDTGKPLFAANGFWAFDPRRWWRLWRESRRS
jgi:hypothetical protein